MFDLLGSGESNVDIVSEAPEDYRSIDWHQDFKSGVRWNPEVFYTDTEIIKGNGADIKVPWELSRFQHLPTLGKAYWLTRDEKYTREFINEITDWIESNPTQFGVNWACSMEIAIRAVNWLWGYYFFKDSPEVSREFLLKFLKSLLVHGRHIRSNLERDWRGINTNHYLSNLVGLIYLGVMLPEFKEAKTWRGLSIKELIKEMRKQVYTDGVDCEGSISYHRLATELFLSATLLCLRNGLTFPRWYMERLEKMLEFVMHYTKSDGTAPQIGDNDDGRLHILADYPDWNRLDHRYLLSAGAVLFDRPDFKQAARAFHEEGFWLVGEEGLKEFEKLSTPEVPVSSRAYSDGGFYIMRQNSLYMIIDCVPVDRKTPSGHKHNSRLSFELFAHGSSFIVDPGAYIYTADKEMRNLFRGTGYHNTVAVDEQEQNRIHAGELFSLGHEAVTRVNQWQVGPEYDLFDGEHTGYRRLKKPVIHRRQIYFDKIDGYWIIRDTLDGEAEHQFDLYFHFAPIQIELDSGPPLVVKTRTEGANLVIIPLETEGISVEILEGWVSYQYGAKLRAPVVRYARKCQAPATFCNIIHPYQTDIDIAEVMAKANKKLDLVL